MKALNSQQCPFIPSVPLLYDNPKKGFSRISLIVLVCLINQTHPELLRYVRLNR